MNSVRSLALAGILGPTSLGIWTFTFSLLNSIRYSSLGLPNLIYIRSNLSEYLKRYEAYLFSVFFKLSVPFIFVLAAYGYFAIDFSAHNNSLFYVFFFLILGILTQLQTLTITWLLLKRELVFLGWCNNIFSVLALFLSLGFGYLYGLFGVIGAYIVSLCVFLIFSWVYSMPNIEVKPLALRSKKGAAVIVNSLKSVSPGFLYFLFINVDSWLIIFKYGEKYLGYFAIYVAFVNIALIGPSSISSFIYSYFSKRVSGSASYVIYVTIFNMLISLLVCIVAFNIFSFVINNWLTSYQVSIEIIELLLWSIPFLSANNLLSNYFVANRKIYIINILVFLLVVIKIISILISVELMLYCYSLIWINVLFGFGYIYMGFNFRKRGNI